MGRYVIISFDFLLIQIVFDDEKYAKHVMTTEEIKEACKDVKVLGKSDIK